MRSFNDIDAYMYAPGSAAQCATIRFIVKTQSSPYYNQELGFYINRDGINLWNFTTSTRLWYMMGVTS